MALLSSAGTTASNSVPIVRFLSKSSRTLNVTHISLSSAIFIIGAPVPTSSPTLGNISDTSPEAGAIR